MPPMQERPASGYKAGGQKEKTAKEENGRTTTKGRETTTTGIPTTTRDNRGGADIDSDASIQGEEAPR